MLTCDIPVTHNYGQAARSFNDMLDVLPCNASSPAQKWTLTEDGKIQSMMTNVEMKRIGGNWAKCVPVSGEGCCVVVNNHQSTPGTTLQGDACASSTGWNVLNTSAGTSASRRLSPSGTTRSLRLRRLFGDMLPNVKLEAALYKGMCMTHTPMTPAPPPPPPPPPKMPCNAANSCTIVSHATVEVLSRSTSTAFVLLSSELFFGWVP